MLKADAQPRSDTQQRILAAALETIKKKGFSGTTARSVARAGGFNQALIFYHFGSVNDLLLEALDETSRMRMEAYESLLEEVTSIEDLIAAALAIYREDLDSGHITVLAEMIAGSLSTPELEAQIVTRMEPWIAFAKRAIEKVMKDSPLFQVVATPEIAFGIVSFYLGIELMNHLGGNRARAESLFEAARSAAPALTSLMDGLT